MAAAGFRLALVFGLFAGCTSINATNSTFEGTSWQVTAIDNQPTPRTDAYRMTFRSGQLGARFGCNHIGGNYRATGGTLIATNVHSTLMGCPELAGALEREALAVLQQPMRISWSSGAALKLSNSAGSMELQRYRR